jgi:hypothetical protein
MFSFLKKKKDNKSPQIIRGYWKCWKVQARNRIFK